MTMAINPQFQGVFPQQQQSQATFAPQQQSQATFAPTNQGGSYLTNNPPPSSAPNMSSNPGPQNGNVSFGPQNGAVPQAKPVAQASSAPAYSPYNGNYGAQGSYGQGSSSTTQTENNLLNTNYGPEGGSLMANSQNATGQQSNLAGNELNQVGYYQNQGAPQMQSAQLGSAPTSLAAQNSGNFNSQGTNLSPTAYAGAANINTYQSNQDRNMQMQNINALQQQAAGQGPSVAAEQAQASSQAAIAGQMATAASQRGSSNASLGMRAAQTQAAANQQQTAQTAVQGRTQEELNAQAQLGQNINNLQGQDTSLAENQAGLQQQTNLSNQSAANSMNLAGAQLGQQNQQFNASNNLSAAQQNAALQEQTNLANQQMQGQYGLQQGSFNQQTNSSNLAASLNQEGMNNSMVSSLYGQAGSLYGNVAATNLNAANSVAGEQAGMMQQNQEANEYADNTTLQVVGAGMQAMGGMSDEDAKENIEEEDGLSQLDSTENTIASNDRSDEAASAASTKKSLSGGGGGMMSGMMSSMSDEDDKEDIGEEDDFHRQSLQDFLDKLKAYSWEYKDKENGKGRFTGVMAQDLEKSPLGKQAVIETPKGKMVDFGRLGSINLAAAAMVNKEVRQLRMDFQQFKEQAMKGRK